MEIHEHCENVHFLAIYTFLTVKTSLDFHPKHPDQNKLYQNDLLITMVLSRSLSCLTIIFVLSIGTITRY